MFAAIKPGGKTSSSYRRRVYPRVPIRRNSFCLDLGQNKACRVLNISEGGLAVQAIANSIENCLPRMRFKFSGSEVWVETGGRVIWVNESRDVAGVEFISLSDEGRDQIREWLAEVRPPQVNVTAQEALQPFHVTNPPDRLDSAASELTGDDGFHPIELGAFAQPGDTSARENVGGERAQYLGDRRWLSLTGLLVFLSTIGLTFFFLGSYVHNAWMDRQQPQDKTVADAIKPPIAKLPSSEHLMAATTLPKPVDPTTQVFGYVLQTAAMAHEENAKALAGLLRQRTFPAFVVNSGSSHFYIVYVGPYRNYHSAVNIDTELLRQGFTAILKRWSPTK